MGDGGKGKSKGARHAAPDQAPAPHPGRRPAESQTTAVIAIQDRFEEIRRYARQLEQALDARDTLRAAQAASMVRTSVAAAHAAICNEANPEAHVQELAALVQVVEPLVVRARPARPPEADLGFVPLLAGPECRDEDVGFEGYARGAGYSTTVTTVPGARGKRVRMNPAVAQQFAAMQQAALADGITLELESGARTNDEQKELYDGYEAKKSSVLHNAKMTPYRDDPRLPPQLNAQLRSMFSRDNLYSMATALGVKADPKLRKYNLAAKPGHSNHQDPLGSQAVDIANASNAKGSIYQWLKAHANEHGFVRTVRTENWHWEYRPGLSGWEHGKAPHKR